MKYILALFFILLVSCTPAAEEPVVEEELVVEEPVVEEVIEEEVTDVVVSCEDEDGGNNPLVKGKVRLIYENGQKESFNDKCLGDENPFEAASFQVEYICEGLKPVTKINVCDGACDKGACISS